jgi:hypothetical protein
VILARLDSYPELLGPAWHAAFGGDLASNTALRFMAAGNADPHTIRRLGQARLARFIWRYSHGHWGEELASKLLAAAAKTLALWDGELDYTELAADIAAEGRLALSDDRTEASEIEDLLAAAFSELHEVWARDEQAALGIARWLLAAPPSMSRF